jgi:hypothetical protein
VPGNVVTPVPYDGNMGSVCESEWRVGEEVTIEALVQHAVEAVAVLAGIDPAVLDAEGVTQWAEGVERLRRQVDAAGVAVAGHVDAVNPFHDQGFFNARGGGCGTGCSSRRWRRSGGCG